jgi:hypothetical protein
VPAREPVTLRLNYRTEKGIPERAREFEAAPPGTTVDLVADSGYEKLIALAAAGDLGDVIWASAGIGTYYELAAPGAFRQLDALATRDRFDLKQYFPAAVEAARLDGKLVGLPEVIPPSHIGLFSNATLFESAGLKPPTLPPWPRPWTTSWRRRGASPGAAPRTAGRRSGGSRPRPPTPPAWTSCAASGASSSTRWRWAGARALLDQAVVRVIMGEAARAVADDVTRELRTVQERA